MHQYPILQLTAVFGLAILQLLQSPPIARASLSLPPELKIELAQLSPVVGDFRGNIQKIKEAYLHAVDQGVDLVITPELSILGYPPGDLLDRPDMVQRNEAALTELRELTRGQSTLLLVGHVTKNPRDGGKNLHNTVSALFDGKILHQQHKLLLPTYQIFDEARYFEPGTTLSLLEFKGHKIGIGICEDFWREDLSGGRHLYAQDPIEILRHQKPEILISLSASPYQQGKLGIRESVHAEVARRVGVPLIYTNQVGATDELLFDGDSFILDAQGRLQGRLAGFRPESGQVSWSANHSEAFKILTPSAFSLMEETEISRIHRALVMGIQDYLQRTGQKKIILGLSGGIDSAVVAALAVEAVGKLNVVGIALPSQYNSTRSIEDAKKLAENLGIEFYIRPIQQTFEAAKLEGKMPFGIAQENTQARIRGLFLWGESNAREGMVVAGTGNKSEFAQGFSTLGGDGLAAFFPIGDLYKPEVYALAQEINRVLGEVIPQSTIDAEPSAELAPGQKDSDRLPPYKILTELQRDYLENQLTVEELARRYTDQLPDKPQSWVYDTITQLERQEFKRKQSGPIFRVSKHAFGMGRRIPIAKVWDAGKKGEKSSSSSPPFESETLALLRAIDQRFRNPKRSIAAQTLIEEALPRIGPELLKKLITISREDLLQTLKKESLATLDSKNDHLKLNQGVAENLLKIHQLAKNCHGLCAVTENSGRDVAGLPAEELEKAIASLGAGAVNPSQILASESHSNNLLMIDCAEVFSLKISVRQIMISRPNHFFE